MDDRQDMPADGIRRQHMPHKSGNVPQFVGFVTVNLFVVILKFSFEEIHPQSVDFGEPLSLCPHEGCVGAFLSTALNNHLG